MAGWNKILLASLHAGCAFGAFVSASAAHAQSGAAGFAEDTENATELSDIVVTARKKSETLRDVPASVAVLSGATLVEKNIARLTDIVTVAPTFTVSLAANQPLTYVRGFGSAGNPSFEQSVGKFADNVSFGRDFQARIPIYDLERTEVLKGPQVLLYGNSATAGAISLVTRKPGNELSGDLSASYEFENNETLIQGGITTPIEDGVSLRVAGFFQDLSRGWILNVGNDRHEPTFRNWGLRGTLKLEPASELSVMLKAEVDRVRDRGSTSQPITQALAPIRQMPDVTFDRRRNVNYNVAPFFTEEYAALDTEIYQADLVYDFGGAKLSSTTAYSVNHQGSASSNGSNKTTVIPAFDQRYRQFSQELRLSGSSGAIEYLAGAYFQRDSYDIYSFQPINLAAYNIPAPPFSRLSTASQTSSSYSLFGELTYRISPELSLSAGSRYSIVRKTTDQAANPTDFFGGIRFGTPLSAGTSRLNPALNPVYSQTLGGIPHTFNDIKTREEHFQPQVILQYRPSSRTMAYLKFVKGNKAGGVDVFYHGSVARGANVDDARFRPEEAISFEAGIKGKTADNRLEYGIGMFNTEFRNLQTGIFIGTAIFTTNAGKSRTRGIEADFNWAATDEVRISGTASYQDAKYLDYPGAACTVSATVAGTCSAATGGQDLGGHPTPFASKFLGSLAIEHRGSIGRVTTTAGISVVYRSRYNTSLNDDPLGDQNGYASLDAHFDLGLADGRFTASLFGRNLADTLYKEYGTATPLVPGSFLVFAGRGRQLGIRLAGNF